MEDPRNFTVLRETRFCTCGWSVLGTVTERRFAINVHHASGDHERRATANQERTAMTQADAAFWCEVEAW